MSTLEKFIAIYELDRERATGGRPKRRPITLPARVSSPEPPDGNPRRLS